MSQVVKAYFREFDFLQGFREFAGHRVGMHWCSNARGEDEIVIVPPGARPLLLLFLLLSVPNQRR